jgi:hypothetical protein
MSLKDQMPFFNDPPPWHYRLMAVLDGLVILRLLYPSVMCLLGHEYWLFLIFGGTIFFMVLAIRGLLYKARIKENERTSKSRDLTPGKSSEPS